MGALQIHEAQKHCIVAGKTFFGRSLDGYTAFEVFCKVSKESNICLENLDIYHNIMTVIKQTQRQNQNEWENKTWS